MARSPIDISGGCRRRKRRLAGSKKKGDGLRSKQTPNSQREHTNTNARRKRKKRKHSSKNSLARIGGEGERREKRPKRQGKGKDMLDGKGEVVGGIETASRDVRKTRRKTSPNRLLLRAFPPTNSPLTGSLPPKTKTGGKRAVRIGAEAKRKEMERNGKKWSKKQRKARRKKSQTDATG